MNRPEPTLVEFVTPLLTSDGRKANLVTFTTVLEPNPGTIPTRPPAEPVDASLSLLWQQVSAAGQAERGSRRR
jgi:hypothetical protein